METWAKFIEWVKGLLLRIFGWFKRIYSGLINWLKERWKSIRRRFILPLMIRMIGYLSEKADFEDQGPGLSDWKRKALKDFKFWLEDIPEEEKDDSCDLFTLLNEFTSLRQEIKLQNSEQSKSIETLSAFIDSYNETAEIFKEKAKALSELEERVRISSEKRAVMPFLDMREALYHGLLESRKAAESKGFFKSTPKGIEGICEGYESALKNFDRALELVGIRVVGKTGEPFDAGTMKANDKKIIKDMEQGLVAETVVFGFVRGNELIRPAEVVVSLSPSTE